MSWVLGPESRVSGWDGGGCSGRTPIYPTSGGWARLIVDGGPVIMAKIFGVFGTKTCSFIKENRTKNGPLVFRTVLCSKHDEKLGNWERKTLREVVGCGIVRFRSIFVCQMLELARNHMVLLLGKLCDRNLYSTINFTEITGSAMFKWHLFWLDVFDF